MSSSAPRRIYLSPPHVGSAERQLLLDAFDSNWIAPLGPHVDAFERELAERTGRSGAVALSSGTAALHLALHVLGVGAGDTVVVSDLTFVATANAVRYVGAEPHFVDAAPETWNMSPELFEATLAKLAVSGRQAAAAIIVDLYGECASYEQLLPIAERYGVPVIEDAAESLGATHSGRPAGSFGSLAALSFNGNKIATTSGGGALVADDPELLERVRYLATQAREPVAHYEHREVGFNYRLSNLLAAVGRGQLRTLDERIDRLHQIRETYRARLGDLPGVDLMPEDGAGRGNGWLTCVLIDPDRFGTDRETVRLTLERANIESRPLWKPMHLQPAYADAPITGGAVSERLFERGLCLPSGSDLSEADLDRIVSVLASAREEAAA